MNSKEIGKTFEEECIPILQQCFDKVKWLAGKNAKSKFDFVCEKNGKNYNVEAKFLSSNKKPRITHEQISSDLIICKIHGELILYTRDTILDNFNIKNKTGVLK